MPLVFKVLRNPGSDPENVRSLVRKYFEIFSKNLLTNKEVSCIVLFVAEVSDNIRNARVAQLVERDLAKVEAAGSSPVSRFCFAQKGHLVDASFLCKKSPAGLKRYLRNTVRGLGGPKVLLGRFKADVHWTS